MRVSPHFFVCCPTLVKDIGSIAIIPTPIHIFGVFFFLEGAGMIVGIEQGATVGMGAARLTAPGGSKANSA